MSTYEPGTVAVATVRGVPNVRVFRDCDNGCSGWALAERVKDCVWMDDEHVTDVRPLVVLDLGASVPSVVVNVLRKAAYSSLANQIEAQTKPPRIPEPGLWGVVKAWHKDETESDVCEWVRGRGLTPWRCECGKKAIWSNLVDPVLVREGVES